MPDPRLRREARPRLLLLSLRWKTGLRVRTLGYHNYRGGGAGDGAPQEAGGGSEDSRYWSWARTRPDSGTGTWMWPRLSSSVPFPNNGAYNEKSSSYTVLTSSAETSYFGGLEEIPYI